MDEKNLLYYNKTDQKQERTKIGKKRDDFFFSFSRFLSFPVSDLFNPSKAGYFNPLSVSLSLQAGRAPLLHFSQRNIQLGCMIMAQLLLS